MDQNKPNCSSLLNFGNNSVSSLEACEADKYYGFSDKKTKCSVPGCEQKRDGKSLHCFPDDAALRKLWVHKLKIVNNISKYSRLCSKHFVEVTYFYCSNPEVDVAKNAIADLKKSNIKRINRNNWIKQIKIPGSNTSIINGLESLSETLNPNLRNADDAQDELLKRSSEIKVQLPNTCKVCYRVYKYPSYLDRHILRQHTSKQNFKCTRGTCNQMFSKIEDAQLHLKSHNIIQELTCSSCDAEFTSIIYLKEHKLKVHGINSDENTNSISRGEIVVETNLNEQRALTEYMENIKHKPKIKIESTDGKLMENYDTYINSFTILNYVIGDIESITCKEEIIIPE